MIKNAPKKRHPLFTKELTPLSFENLSEDSVIELTDTQKADGFLAKYMQNVDPIEKYETYFSGGAKSIDHILNEIKNFYRAIVLSEKNPWTEKKFVAALHYIFTNNLTLSYMTFDRVGRVCETGNTRRARR